MIQGQHKPDQPRSRSFGLLTYPWVRSGDLSPSGLADGPSAGPGFGLTQIGKRPYSFSSLFALFFLLVLLSGTAFSACREDNLAGRLIPPAYAASVDATIKYFGHNFFQIITSKGTSIATDPLAPGMYPDPQISADVVTVGREHMNHNYVPIIRGAPRVLRGLRDFGTDWNQVRVNVKDVFIYDIPIYQNGFDEGSIKGAAFIFDLGKLCIAHLGDLGHKLTAKQLKWIGKIDIALTPISGRWTMDPDTARVVINQLKPKIAIPMHHRDNMQLVRRFAKGFPLRHLETNTLEVSKEALPSSTEVIVLTPPGAQTWE